MRRSFIITTALVAGAALAAGGAAGAPAKSAKTRITCTLQLFAQGPPQGTPPGGIQFGFPACPRPFGTGVHYDAYTITPTGAGQGSIAGIFKNYYDRGTARGTFALTFSATSPTDIAYTGTVTYTRGTGAFSHLRGRGTITCTSSDGGAHKACRVHSTLTGI
ncbi:MAG: hypothetical protein QOJ35_2673 [Solirubrobacteraceae bacterium]|jgi:hypothetical protein|nr:hypothetical protein [Solirubrobacteraceae bacterium]